MDLTRPSVPWSRRQNFPAGLISVVGTVLLGIVSWHLLSTHIWVMLAETDPARFALEAIEAVLMTGPPLLLIYAGYWTSNRDVPRDGQWLLVQWVLVGLVSVSGVIAAITVHHVLLGDPVRNTLVEMELLTGAGVGCLLGFAVGNGRVESELRTATIEDQRDAFLFLNRLLRHHILNSIQIVDGYAARLDDYDDPELQQVHEIVRTRSQEITSFIRNIQVIVRTFTDDPSLEAVDLVAVVEAECDDARDVYEHAEIETDLPESIHVRSNESLAVVLRNLIDNAVQHNDQTTPRVRAEVSDRGRTVRLRISDNGPGIPESEREQLFEPGGTGDRGTGLYLANRVIAQQRGQLRIEDTSPNGTVVTLELPKPTARKHHLNPTNSSPNDVATNSDR